MEQTAKKCPACRSNDFIIIECWEGHTISWECVNGQFDKSEGALEPGNPTRVEALCRKCGHRWKFNGAIQIGDIII